MVTVKTTVIAKTDIVEYTPRISKLSEAELSKLLSDHQTFVSGIVTKFEGSIVKGEGDSFWIIFPSVTTAVLAAIEMHDALRVMQAGRGEEKCLAIRVAITVGDILHQENDIFGFAVNLLARIETITPANERIVTLT